MVFAQDATACERMKLRMPNGTHSMLADVGFLSGKTSVREVVADPVLSQLVVRHLRAAAATLPMVPGMDVGGHATALMERFANPAIAHATYQIAMDGTEKLPQRIFSAALDAMTMGQDLQPFAFATAAWARDALGRKDDGTHALRDPREDLISTRIGGATDAPSGAHAVLVLDQAGWHGARALVAPDNLTLVPLPPYSPELDPVERVWLYPRKRCLSHRFLENYKAIVDACCAA